MDARLASTGVNPSLIIARLTALWALAESGLGGLLHAFNTPFTGIMVGGIAVVVIILIGYYGEGKAAVLLKALIIVLTVKVAVSPHSPPMAYVAVSFQAFIGAFLFFFLSNPKVIGPILGMLALAESALQKLLTLTIVFGKSIWEAFDQFTEFVQQQMGMEVTGSGSFWLAGTYLVIYLFAGAVIGWWGGNLPSRMEDLLQTWKIEPVAPTASPLPKKKPKFWQVWFRRMSTTGLVIVFILLVIWGLKDRESLDPISLILRALCVIVLWYGILSPILMEGIRMLLAKKHGKNSTAVLEVMSILPYLRSVAKLAWRESASAKGMARLPQFLSRMIVYSISLEIQDEHTFPLDAEQS